MPTNPVEPRRSRWLRFVLGLATATMLALSWPLWTTAGDFPRVPFLASIPQTSGSGSWVIACVIALAVVLTGVARRWRFWYALSLVGFGVLWLQDQHRFQAWAYQYGATGVLLAVGAGAGRWTRVRGWYVALYAHSALSKLDRSFADELGARFLGVVVRPFGLEPAGWPDGVRLMLILAMPAGELAVAAALAWPRARRWGLAGATFLHLALIGILGPFGLGHSTIVLVWNAAMLVEVWIAFGPSVDPLDPPRSTLGKLATMLGWMVFSVGVTLPFGERWGWFDAWPSHALYASHVERLTIDIHEEELDRLPESVRRHVSPVADGPWRRLDLTAWSRAERGTPPYPQNRAGLGLAEALAARYGGRGLVRVILQGPADRWTGRRSRTELIGLEAIRRWGDRSRLNAHPWVPPGSDPGPDGDRPAYPPR